MTDDLVKRLMHRSHPLHIEAAKRIQSQAARIERLEAAQPVLEQAREAMRWGYDVCDYPADGNTAQDRAIAAIDALLAKLEKEEE